MSFSRRKYWGESIEYRGCIPRKVPKKNTPKDEPLRHNKKKLEFCERKTNKEYKGFCNEPRFELILPALQTNKSLVKEAAYHTPLFVFASKNLEVFISCLDSLIHQPGALVPFMTVLYEEEDPDIKSVAKIYGMRLNKTKIGNNFEERLQIAKDVCKEIFPRKEYLIVVDSDVIPSPDFLFFLAQLFSPLTVEDKVSAISAWSANCYKHEGDVHLAYRIQGQPKYAALIPVRELMRNTSMDIYVPDVSRVQGLEACHTPSLEPDNWIDRPQDLKTSRYYFKLVMLLQLSYVVDLAELMESCSTSALKNTTNVVYTSSEPLPNILKCLGILNGQYGEYNGLVRLSVDGKNVIVVTKSSAFYNSRPIPSVKKAQRLELSKNDVKTSTQIGLAYVRPMSVMYEKHPMPKLPKLRLQKGYKSETTDSNVYALRTTYNESYKYPAPDENINFFISKLPETDQRYFKYGKNCRPLKFEESEYMAEYPIKEHPKHSQGINIEKATTLPMILIGRDERECLPLTSNYGKYLDIYVSTSRMAHRAFTMREQKTIAMKNIVTSQETMGIPRGRGFGCKFQEFAGQDLDNRDPKMIDKIMFKTTPKPKVVAKRYPKVPNFGSESEARAAYKKPQGIAKAHIFDRFVEYPEGIPAPAPRQNLCAPGMYTTEMHAINNHTSPQVVV